MKRKFLFGALALTAGAIAIGISATSSASAAFAEDAIRNTCKWYPDFINESAVDDYAKDLNIQIMEESVILLKNENDALPIARSEKASILGNCSYHFVAAGTGSGSGAGIRIDLPTALRNNGIAINAMAEDFYSRLSIPRMTVTSGMFGASIDVQEDPALLETIEGSIRTYDTVFWTISRTGGEGDDLPMFGLPKSITADPTKHYLQLNDNEEKMLHYLEDLKASGIVKKVVVLINSCNVLEMGPLQDSEGIDSILWVGQPGLDGIQGIANVITGKACPSGRTVDVWTRDHKLDPVWQNFGSNNQNAGAVVDAEGNMATNVSVNGDGELVINATSADNPNAFGVVDPRSDYYSNSLFENTGSETDPVYSQITRNGGTHTLEYEEGIYLGYKYFETAYADEVEGFDYDAAVCYPFGYGLSYTRFDQHILTTASEIKAAVDGATSAEDTFEIEVEVRNIGNVAGKEVVQIYNHAPYTVGGIEKAEINLIGFEKTKLLAPGRSQVVKVEVRVGDLASFDFNDANENNYKGFELEAGNYEIRLMKNSHELIEALEVNFNEKTTALDNDADVSNNTPFSNGDDFDTLLNLKDADSKSNMHTMSRADFVGTYPTAPKKEDKQYGDRLTAMMYYNRVGTAGSQTGENLPNRWLGDINGSDDLPTDPWYKTNEDIPEGWTQAANTDGRTNNRVAVLLREMAGYDYFDDVTIMPAGHPYAGQTAAKAWESFLNQLTLSELTTMINSGQYKTPALASVGKLEGTDQDGPASLNGGYTFASATNIASTWNMDLAYERGRTNGNYSLFRNTPGWYAPSMNTHRSPFSGRNFEYYSQDGFLAGSIASMDVKGFQDKGGYAFIKHFAVNDQETDRMGTGTFATEQALRENHMKAFEISVKKGEAKSVMSSFNRIGAIPASGNYMSINGILRDEWGFHGHIVTDYYMGPLARGNMAIRAGANMPLGNNNWGGTGGVWDASLRNGKGGVRFGNVENDVMPESPTQYYAIRTAAMQVLWVGANSNNNKNLTESTGIFNNRTVDVKLYDAISENVAIDEAAFGSNNNTYSVSGTLPAGVTFDPATATFSGSPTAVGTYRVTVNVVSDYWIKNSFTVTFNVGNLISIADDNSILIDEGLDLTVQTAPTGNVAFSGITGVRWEATLPDGLSLDEENLAIVGSTSETDYRIKVRLVLEITTKARVQSGWSSRWVTTVENRILEAEKVVGNPAPEVEELAIAGFAVDANGDLIVTYTNGTSANLGHVRGEDGSRGYEGVNGTNGNGIIGIELVSSEDGVDTYEITFSDGSTFTFTVTNGKDGSNGADGVDGKDGANGADGKDGKDGEPGKDGANGKGCGGSIAATSAIIAPLALGGIALLAKKHGKKDDE